MHLVSTSRYTRRDLDKPIITGGIDVLYIPRLFEECRNDPIWLMEKVNEEVVPAIREMTEDQREAIRDMITLFPRIMFHIRDGKIQPFKVRSNNETQLEYRVAEKRSTIDPLLPTDYISSSMALRQYCFFSGIGRASDITKMMKEGRLNSFLREDVQSARGQNNLQQIGTFRAYLLSEVNCLKNH